ncbi:MAG TPA: hypothetical protein VGD95_01910 [Micavibrio sp.]
MSVKLFTSLLYKSAQIQQQIEHEHQRRCPDGFRLLKLKKLRLSIKDRLMRLLESHRGSIGGAMPELQPVRLKRR